MIRTGRRGLAPCGGRAQTDQARARRHTDRGGTDERTAEARIGEAVMKRIKWSAPGETNQPRPDPGGPRGKKIAAALLLKKLTGGGSGRLALFAMEISAATRSRASTWVRKT